MFVGKGQDKDQHYKLYFGYLKMWVQLKPPVSTLACIMWHPRFQDAMEVDDYKNWRQEGVDRFGNMGANRQMYPSNVILHKIRGTG